MRNLFIGVLLVGCFSAPALAQSTIPDDAALERMCADAGYDEGSNDFDRCVVDARKGGAVKKATATDSAAPPAANNPAPAPAQNQKSAGQTFCENYGYKKDTTEYKECMSYAAENGYQGDASKYQEANR